jgi:hypothetical protein
VEHLTAWPLGIHKCSDSRDDEESLIVLKLHLRDVDYDISALVDTGATNNFVRAKTLKDIPPQCWKEKEISPSMLHVRLADGTVVKERKRIVSLRYAHEGKSHNDDFVVLKLDDRFDVILGMPWLADNQPTIDWNKRSVTVNALRDASKQSDEGVVTLHDECNKGDNDEGSPPHHVASSSALCDEGGSNATQKVGREDVKHACNDMRSSREYSPPSILKTSVTKGQRRKAVKEKSCSFPPDLIELANSIEKGLSDSADKDLRVESRDSAQTVRVESHSLCSVIVNTGSQVGVTELELENPPNTVEGLTALPGLSLKKFMKELRTGRISQFCMLTVEGETEGVAAVTAATTSSMNIDVLDDKSRIERYQSQS